MTDRSTKAPGIPTGEAVGLSSLVIPTPHGIASRILAKAAGGNVTLFAFDAGEALTEHTSPYEALAFVLEGACTFTVGGADSRATAGTVVRLPPGVPHALEATEATLLLLVMLRAAP
jgi:quercetin dioxygenase-like cupin family protein